MQPWFMVFTGSLALLLLLSGVDYFFPVDASTLLAWLGVTALFSLLYGLWSIVNKYKLRKLGQFAARLGAEHLASAPAGFLNQFPCAPWRQWSRTIGATRIFRSTAQSPPFCVFDLWYRDHASLDSRTPTVTFIVVSLAVTPSEHLPMPPVPQGYTAVVGGDCLYLYRSTSWFGSADRLALGEIGAALDHARVLAAQLDVLARGPRPQPPAPPEAPAPTIMQRMRIVLIALAWAMVAGVALYGGRYHQNTLVVPLAVACAAWGHVWRRDRSPAWLIVPVVCAVALDPAAALLGLGAYHGVVIVVTSIATIVTVLMAVFGVRRIAAGRHIAAIAAVALTVAGVRDGNPFMLYGLPIGLCLVILMDFFITSTSTIRDSAGKLVWKNGAGVPPFLPRPGR